MYCGENVEAHSLHVLRVSAVARWIYVALSVCLVKGEDFATSTTLTLFSFLKGQVLCSLKILNSLIKMACERRIMVQNLFYFRRPNTSVCTLHACCELCVFAWKIWGYGNVHISKLRKCD